jgi:hypothetical protein
MSTKPSTIYRGRHADVSPAGVSRAAGRDAVANRFPTHPLATYVGEHRGGCTCTHGSFVDCPTVRALNLAPVTA